MCIIQGCYARKYDFRCIFPLKAILPWFNYQCVGREAFCCLPPNLLDDNTWVGFALYVVFRGRSSFSIDSLDSESSPSLVAHLHNHGVVHTARFSLKKDSLVGLEHRLVVFHVPRVHFQQELNQGGALCALFAINSVSDHLEIEICGIRKVHERDMKDLIQTITECTIRSPSVHHQHYYQAFRDMENKLVDEAEIHSERETAFDLGYFCSTLPRLYSYRNISTYMYLYLGKNPSPNILF